MTSVKSYPKFYKLARIILVSGDRQTDRQTDTRSSLVGSEESTGLKEVLGRTNNAYIPSHVSVCMSKVESVTFLCVIFATL
jgi:hypothetical protein